MAQLYKTQKQNSKKPTAHPLENQPETSHYAQNETNTNAPCEQFYFPTPHGRGGRAQEINFFFAKEKMIDMLRKRRREQVRISVKSDMIASIRIDNELINCSMTQCF